MKRLFLLLLLIMVPMLLPAQKLGISTNILGYAALGTMNVEASYSLSRRWSVTAGARYNPFTFGKKQTDGGYKLRQQAYSIGVRMWPWHTLSGWWFATKLRYQEYSMGGIVSDGVREGDRIGTGLCVGYTLMLSRHFNLEFGAGLWAGVDWYRKYDCPVCGSMIEQGTGAFVLSDDLAISVVYVF